MRCRAYLWYSDMECACGHSSKYPLGRSRPVSIRASRIESSVTTDPPRRRDDHDSHDNDDNNDGDDGDDDHNCRSSSTSSSHHSSPTSTSSSAVCSGHATSATSHLSSPSQDSFPPTHHKLKGNSIAGIVIGIRKPVTVFTRLATFKHLLQSYSSCYCCWLSFAFAGVTGVGMEWTNETLQ